MQELEKLYICAEEHLGGSPQNWDGFARAFGDIFAAEMFIYRVAFADDKQTITTFETITTNQPAIVKEYTDSKVYLFRPVPETTMTPLEPALRSDFYSNEEFKALGDDVAFLLKNGLFYMLVVPALLQDGSYLVLAVWRDEDLTDFTDLEKQRLALFMRYMLTLIDPIPREPLKPDQAVEAFGKRYKLTSAETDVLNALLQGRTLKQIASETERSYGTVRWHVQNILEKCQVNDQKSLLREFYRLIKA